MDNDELLSLAKAFLDYRRVPYLDRTANGGRFWLEERYRTIVEYLYLEFGIRFRRTHHQSGPFSAGTKAYYHDPRRL